MTEGTGKEQKPDSLYVPGHGYIHGEEVAALVCGGCGKAFVPDDDHLDSTTEPEVKSWDCRCGMTNFFAFTPRNR